MQEQDKEPVQQRQHIYIYVCMCLYLCTFPVFATPDQGPSSVGVMSAYGMHPDHMEFKVDEKSIFAYYFSQMCSSSTI